MDAKGSVDAATVDADENSVPEKNNFSPRRIKYMSPLLQVSNTTVQASCQRYKWWTEYTYYQELE